MNIERIVTRGFGTIVVNFHAAGLKWNFKVVHFYHGRVTVAVETGNGAPMEPSEMPFFMMGAAAAYAEAAKRQGVEFPGKLAEASACCGCAHDCFPAGQCKCNCHKLAAADYYAE